MRVGGVGIFGTALPSCGAGVIGLPGTGAKTGRSAISEICGSSGNSGFSIAASSSSDGEAVGGFIFGGGTRGLPAAGVVAWVAAGVASAAASADPSATDSSFFFSRGGLRPPTGGRNGFVPLPPTRIDGRVEAAKARPFGGAARPALGRGRSGGNGNSSSLDGALRPSCFLWRNLSRILFAVASSTELEWVFFSATPIVGSTARTSDALTSNSRASSLIRIFVFPVNRCVELAVSKD